MNQLKLYFLVLILVFSAGQLRSQDLLFFKSDPSNPVKCTIIQVSEAEILYKLHETDDIYESGAQEIRSVLTSKVLSYSIDKDSKILETNITDDDESLLEMYLMGETTSGYIIKSIGDTIEGFITAVDVVSNQFEIKFTGKDGISTTYTPDSIVGYGYGKVTYSVVETGYTKPLHPTYKNRDGKLFLHQICSGRANAYRLYKIEFNKGLLTKNPYPPIYKGKLSREFFILTDKTSVISIGKSSKGTLFRVFPPEEYKDFARLVEGYKIPKSEIGMWVNRFNLMEK